MAEQRVARRGGIATHRGTAAARAARAAAFLLDVLRLDVLAE
jgi:hypothetical protein